LPFHSPLSPPLHDRRGQILALLADGRQPLTGGELSARLGVSRQVIVQDMAILRAEGHDIVATPRGYLMPEANGPRGRRAVLACRHDASRVEEELCVMVDHGLMVVDVIVEHAFYGELRGNLMLCSRVDVGRFMARMNERRAQFLSALTGGVHLHTVEHADQAAFDQAVAELGRRGLLVTP